MVQHRTFFDRFGHAGICLLPGEVLSDDPLIDPETGAMLPSLREQVGLVNGTHHHLFCYAHVLRTCGDGLYWADVAATPELLQSQACTARVILAEEDLYFALPYDIRLQGKSPADMLKAMEAHARTVRPVQRRAPEDTSELIPAPVLPLAPLTVVEVSTEELQEAIGPVERDTLKDTNQHQVAKPIGAFGMQQAFLQAMLDSLMHQLYQVQDTVAVLALKARCALVALLQRWQSHTRQRMINAVPVWNSEQHLIAWHLTVGVPVAARAAT
jgi:hypothetical protein